MSVRKTFHYAIAAMLINGCCVSCASNVADGQQRAKKSIPIVRQGDEPSPTALKIVEFAHQNMGKEVGDGRCWSLANLAYRHAGIEHRCGYVWGRRVDWEREGVRPGDIIQFKYARYPYAYTDENHTSIILEVANRHSVKVAHQHWNGLHRVTSTYIPLPYLRSGEQTVYRHEP